MFLKKWHRKRTKLLMLAGAGFILGSGLACVNQHVSADDVPQTINIGPTTYAVSYGLGYREVNRGPHNVDVLREAGSNEYIFCIQWAKNSPSNMQLQRKWDADPRVQWLITNFFSGNRYRSLGMGDEADYWLYQVAVHIIASPNDRQSDGSRPADALPRFRADIRQKAQDLVDEANRHNSQNDSQVVLNSASTSFNPGEISVGRDDIRDGQYKKNFSFNTQNVSNAHVWLEGAPGGVSLSGKDGAGVNFNDVWNGTALQVNIPLSARATDNEYSFKVKANGTWNKQVRVAVVYGNSDNSVQNVAKNQIKAINVADSAYSEMNVKVYPAKARLDFTKKGTGNNNTDILVGTGFKLIGLDNGFTATSKADNNGRVNFENIPLGSRYHIEETEQPNKDYVPNYVTDINDFTGSNPKLSVSLGNNGVIFNRRAYVPFELTKKNTNGQGIEGAKFVIVRKPRTSVPQSISINDAKKDALRLVDGHLVSGHTDQQPYITTTNKDGKVLFNSVEIEKNSRYYAVEIEAPNGYALSQTSYSFDLTENSPSLVKGEITDSTNPLPSTGSNRLVSVVGVSGVLVLITAGLLVYLRRKQG